MALKRTAGRAFGFHADCTPAETASALRDDGGNISQAARPEEALWGGKTGVSSLDDLKHNHQDNGDLQSSAELASNFENDSWGLLKHSQRPAHLYHTADPQAKGKKKNKKEQRFVQQPPVTRQMAKFRTFKATLDTGELLEKVLCCLPAHALVTLRRVNKNWNHIIMTLPVIRRKLFLEAQPINKQDFWVYDSANQLLQPHIPGMCDLLGPEWSERQSYCRASTSNPLLFRRDRDATTGNDIIPDMLHRAHVCENLRLVARPNLHKPLGTSIFHDMFITQPPVTTVEFLFYCHDRARSRLRVYSPVRATRLRIKVPGGVRFRDLLQAFLDEAHAGFLESVYGPADLCVRVQAVGKKKAAIWALGAIFVSAEEEARVERLKERWVVGEGQGAMQLSPQARRLVRENNGRRIDFRPTSDDFVDTPRKVRGEGEGGRVVQRASKL